MLGKASGTSASDILRKRWLQFFGKILRGLLGLWYRHVQLQSCLACVHAVPMRIVNISLVRGLCQTSFLLHAGFSKVAARILALVQELGAKTIPTETTILQFLIWKVAQTQNYREYNALDGHEATRFLLCVRTRKEHPEANTRDLEHRCVPSRAEAQLFAATH